MCGFVVYCFCLAFNIPMLKKWLQVRCKSLNFYILNFFLKNNFVYQGGHVGGVNKQMAAMLEKQSSPLETKLY